MRHLMWAGAAAMTLALGACDRADAPAATPTAGPAPAATLPAPAASAGFTHSNTVDLFGYYSPLSEVTVGRHQLAYIGLGAADDLAKWEGGERMDTWAPVMIVFDDTTSPMVQGELGGESHSVSVRVLPNSYAVTDSAVTFSGTAAELGAVSFRGTIDPAATTPQRGEAETGGAVLTGDLTVGERTFPGVMFSWSGGD